MNNVIPIRPDPLRKAFEVIDTLKDTKLSPGQERIADEALSWLQKAIEERYRNGDTTLPVA